MIDVPKAKVKLCMLKLELELELGMSYRLVPSRTWLAFLFFLPDCVPNQQRRSPRQAKCNNSLLFATFPHVFPFLLLLYTRWCIHYPILSYSSCPVLSTIPSPIIKDRS